MEAGTTPSTGSKTIADLIPKAAEIYGDKPAARYNMFQFEQGENPFERKKPKKRLTPRQSAIERRERRIKKKKKAQRPAR